MQNWITLLILPIAQLMMVTEVDGDSSVSFAFVIDDSGSMGTEISAVREGVKRLIDETHREISNYIVVPYNDPNVGPAFQSTSKSAISNFVDGITPSGGGDCPELAMAALRKAINLSAPSSLVFFFSDASAKDYHLNEDVSKAASEKNIMIYFLLTGCCSDCTSTRFQAYKSIETYTGAKMYQITKSGVEKFMKYVIVAVLEDIKRLWYPPATFSLVVDIGEKKIALTVSVSVTSLMSDANKNIMCSARSSIINSLKTHTFYSMADASSKMTATFSATETTFDALSSLYKEYVAYKNKHNLTEIAPVVMNRVSRPSSEKICVVVLNSYLLLLDTNGLNTAFLVFYHKSGGSVKVETIKNVTGYVWECPPFIPTIRMSVIDHICSAMTLQSNCLFVVLLLLLAKWFLNS